ncbi:MAG: DUF4157 domain-containing protein [Luteimonas sp.]|nr:DUF4157 domain-containing protein [Luteimonas sp.]
MKHERLLPPRTAPDRAPAPDVRKALDGPAGELPSPVNAELARHYGRDFGDVRIHADAEAGATAIALGAEAYTIGRDIVFAPGAYRPGSPDGRKLIAHEAAHVVQQGARPAPGGALRLDAGDGLAEREATHAADGFDGQDHAAALTTHQSPRLQRSLLGSILGGVAGLGAGLALGSVLGPLGMVIGGIAGLVAGAVIGDAATHRSRDLTIAEKIYLHEIYLDSVDYDKVSITRGSAFATGAARTIGNTIHLQDRYFAGDTMDLSDEGRLVLAHEMGHVWQYQNGGLDYIPSSLIPQFKAWIGGGDRNAAYDWRDAARKHIDWSDWNAEQQAECISDYNAALRRLKGNAYPGDAAGAAQRLQDLQTVSMAQPYIELVRAGIGAPGSRRRGTTAAPADQGGGT